MGFIGTAPDPLLDAFFTSSCRCGRGTTEARGLAHISWAFPRTPTARGTRPKRQDRRRVMSEPPPLPLGADTGDLDRLPLQTM